MKHETFNRCLPPFSFVIQMRSENEIICRARIYLPAFFSGSLGIIMNDNINETKSGVLSRIERRMCRQTNPEKSEEISSFSSTEAR